MISVCVLYLYARHSLDGQSAKALAGTVTSRVSTQVHGSETLAKIRLRKESCPVQIRGGSFIVSTELIIFGRSPFINQVDVPRLLDSFTTVGFNHFGKYHCVDYLFFFDDFYDGFYGPRKGLFIPEWFAENLPGTRYAPKPLDRPLLKQTEGEKILQLAHKHYTASLALDWALLQGFSKIYLIGIDHVETDRAFAHHDGIDGYAELTPQSHRDFKEFVHNCAAHADIYQCNPAVADQWLLPYKDVRDLYVQAEKEHQNRTDSAGDAASCDPCDQSGGIHQSH